jgi:putative copper export protein
LRFFPVFNHWLHLASVVFWIGGLAFQVFILSPFLQRGNPTYAFLEKISKRFRLVVGPLLLVLVVTGGINFHFRWEGYNEDLPAGYISALGVKVFLLATAASLYFFGLLKSDPEEKERGEKEAEPAIPDLIYAKLTLAIGVVMIFLAAMLRQWKV